MKRVLRRIWSTMISDRKKPKIKESKTSVILLDHHGVIGNGTR